MLFIPVVGGVVIHGDFFPNSVGHKTHRVGVEGSSGLNGHGAIARIVTPRILGERRIFRPVVYLPVFHGLPAVVDFELLFKKTFHQGNGQFSPFCGLRRCHQEALLQLIHIFGCPFVVVANQADGGINPVACVQDLIGKLRAVAVTDDVGSPLFRKLQCELFISRFPGKCEPSLFVFRIHYVSSFFCFLFRFSSFPIYMETEIKSSTFMIKRFLCKIHLFSGNNFAVSTILRYDE